MIKIYTDASFDRFSGLACYCVVVVEGKRKTWTIGTITDCTTSTQAELAGIQAAIALAAGPTIIYCDSISAIQQATSELTIPANTEIKYFKGHQLGQERVNITDDVKRHHWADCMAGLALKEKLTDLKTVAYNEDVKETSNVKH